MAESVCLIQAPSPALQRSAFRRAATAVVKRGSDGAGSGEVLRRKEIFEAMAESSGRDKELPGAPERRAMCAGRLLCPLSLRWPRKIKPRLERLVKEARAETRQRLCRLMADGPRSEAQPYGMMQLRKRPALWGGDSGGRASNSGEHSFLVWQAPAQLVLSQRRAGFCQLLGDVFGSASRTPRA